MKTLITTLLLLLVFSSHSQNESLPYNRTLLLKESGLNQERIKLIQETFLKLPSNAQLAFGFIHHDSVWFIGCLKIGEDVFAVKNRDSIFEIGSLTKVFTATILSQLVNENLVKLNDKISKYTPFKVPSKITLLQLANHTSGLPRLPSDIFLTMKELDNPYKYYLESDLESYIKDVRVKSSSISEYSNLGYGVLGYTIGQIEGESYEEVLKKRFCEPLKLEYTTLDFEKVKSNLVKGHDKKGEPVKNWEWGSSLCAAGGIFSSCSDMVKFLQMNLDSKNEAVKLAKEETIQVNEELSVGLGWHIIKNSESRIDYWHNGRTGGYSSSLAFNDIHQSGVVILSNISTDVLDELCISLIKTIPNK